MAPLLFANKEKSTRLKCLYVGNTGIPVYTAIFARGGGFGTGGKTVAEGTQGIYIHIPFCRAKCGYCDFNSYAGMEEQMAPYAAAVLAELRQYSGRADTIYFGGGTPTLLPLPEMESILNALAAQFHIAPDAEITLEANPATFDLARAAAYRAMGFNRMSIGVQNFSDALLRRLGRLHDGAQAQQAVEAAACAGFTNLSIDLMYALPGQTPQAFRQDLQRLNTLPVTHVSAYGLKVEEGTPFANGQVVVDEDDYAQMYQDLCSIVPDMGFGQYEISNFAKTGAESRHNLKYWGSAVPISGWAQARIRLTDSGAGKISAAWRTISMRRTNVRQWKS